MARCKSRTPFTNWSSCSWAGQRPSRRRPSAAKTRRTIRSGASFRARVFRDEFRKPQMERMDIMSKKTSITRRRFLGAAAGAVAVPFVVPSSILGLRGAVPPSEKLVMGVIGVGGMGTHNLKAFMGKKETQVVAVCDVDKEHLDAAAGEVEKQYGNKDVKKFRDFRELLAQKDIAAVVVAT